MQRGGSSGDVTDTDGRTEGGAKLFNQIRECVFPDTLQWIGSANKVVLQSEIRATEDHDAILGHETHVNDNRTSSPTRVRLKEYSL